MKCNNCGADLAPGSRFCDECGAEASEVGNVMKKFCGSCGSPMEIDEVFCGNCGTPADGARVNNQANYTEFDEYLPEQNYIKGKSGGRKTGLIVTTAVMAVIVVCMAAFIAWYVISTRNENSSDEMSDMTRGAESEQIENESKNEAEPENSVQADDLATGSDTGAQNNESGSSPVYPQLEPSSVEGYMMYKNTAGTFSFIYPSDLNVSVCSDSSFEAASANGECLMKASRIEASSIDLNADMNGYIASTGGSVDYRSTGDSYYAVRTLSGSVYHYKYAKKSNGAVYSFSMDFPSSQFTYYDNIINKIYADMIKQF